MRKGWRAFVAAVLCMGALGMLLASPFSARAEQAVVRVLLTRLALTDQLMISLDGSYEIGGIAFQRGSKLLISCVSGRVMVYYEGMAFDAGEEAILLRHQTEGEKENGLRLNGGYELYCGDLHVAAEGQRLRAVLHIPVEEYLLGVVPYEMNDAFPLEALKAQAVAARTYALGRTGGNGAYDVVDNTNDQVYRGFQKENANAAQAVQQTAGMCGYVGAKLANCYYTASNGGQVEVPEHVWGKAEGAYITMHEDPYDVENPESAVKTAVIAKEPKDGVLGNDAFTEAVCLALSEPLSALGFTGEAEDVRILRVVDMALQKPLHGEKSLVMTQLRLTLNVEARRVPSQAMLNDQEQSIFQTTAETPQPAARVKGPFIPVEQPMIVELSIFGCVEPLLKLSINGSDNEIFTVSQTEDAFEIAARRYGHGVGMSQRGAQRMAANYGWTYEQILRFYYPGMTLKATSTAVALPSPLAPAFLTTPGPAATPTPRPTLMPATQALKEGEWRVRVTQIGVNSSLNLRSAPSMEADILRLLYYGQELIVEKALPEGWLKVKTDVTEGYVMEKFVERTE